MKKIIIKFILVGSLLIPFFVNSDPIKKIEILGLDVISRGTALSYLPVEVGDNYTTKTLKKIINSLYKTQFFKDIKVNEVNQNLKITVIENPHIKYINLLNYSKEVIDEKIIEKVLSSMNLTTGKVFSKKKLHKLVEQLKAIYINKGYYDVNITEKVEIDSGNRVSIDLDIFEGKVARIKSMHIRGNKVKKEQDLLNFFEIGEPDSSIVNYFTEKDHYSRIELDAGIETLRSYYLNLGYLDFKVTDLKIDLSNDKQHIDIVIQINEGDEYKTGKIKFTGNMLNESNESLSKFITISTGDIFKRRKIVNSVKNITDIYKNQGYAFVEIDAAASESKIANIINLEFKISPKKKAYINRITITGNTRTQDDIIRREIGIYEGGIYSEEELESSVNKLRLLGYFSDVKMEISKLKNYNNKINLNFLVKETKTGSLSAGLSHSNSTGASFNFGIKERNFLGTGNTLNAEIAGSKATKDMSFYFSDPYFTKDKHSISYGIFNKKTDGKKLKVESYKVNEVGGSIGYGIPITKDTRIGLDFRFSSIKITCGATFASPEYEEEQCASNDKTEARLSANWSNNTLNDYNFPTEGSSSDFKINVALPIADFKYYKITTSHKSYYPFSKKLTFKTNVELGLAKGYGGKKLPFFKRYYGGGFSSVRGFDFNSLGSKYLNDKAKGGELSMLMGGSVVSPVSFIGDSESIRMSVFIDAGGISESATNFSNDDFRASVGVGFVWLTPVGPLGMYAAKPLIKKIGDKTKTFQFTLGTSF